MTRICVYIEERERESACATLYMKESARLESVFSYSAKNQSELWNSSGLCNLASTSSDPVLSLSSGRSEDLPEAVLRR